MGEFRTGRVMEQTEAGLGILHLQVSGRPEEGNWLRSLVGHARNIFNYLFSMSASMSPVSSHRLRRPNPPHISFLPAHHGGSLSSRPALRELQLLPNGDKFIFGPSSAGEGEDIFNQLLKLMAMPSTGLFMVVRPPPAEKDCALARSRFSTAGLRRLAREVGHRRVGLGSSLRAAHEDWPTSASFKSRGKTALKSMSIAGCSHGFLHWRGLVFWP